VATLDRYVEAMAKQRGEALVFRPGANPELLLGGQPRVISSRAVTQEQIQLLVAEVLGPDFLSRAAGGQGTFPYQSPYGGVTITVVRGAQGFLVRVVPGGEAPAAAPVTPPRAEARPAMTGTVAAAGEGAAPATIDELFGQMLDARASDLHLKSGKVPFLRVDGSMTPVPGRPPLDGRALWSLVEPIMPERNRAEFAEANDTDFAYELAGRARMRCNVFRDLAGVGAVFRQIPSKILTVKDLGLPRSILELCELDKGLVVVTGPTGSGKSTTLAAMVDYINERRDDHLITIEDPVEFVHRDKRCLINQREVGSHTRGFKAALRAALREDPDIVLVGEMRDLETVAIAIETAETGHLVFGTLHTNTAASTVDRIIDQFPTDRQAQIRMMLSESLKGVVAQTLLRRKGGGRVAALEILLVTPAVSNLIREGKTFQIGSVMQTGRGMGMQTISDAMIELVKAGTVEPQEAYDRSPVKKEFGLLLTRSGFKGPWSEGAAA
jgi:twitching motility protein PilT